jgi:UDPglucose--hexose-1-phosphate uridylyltransferase
MHALLNEGREAGASLPHSHTQLAWLREAPPAVVAEDGQGSDCAVCAHIASELAISNERAILEFDGVVLLAAYGGRLPYELLIAPREHPDGSGYESELLHPALTVLADALRRLHAVEGPVPLNAWLHNNGHWHVEVLPRLTVFAGIELGAGIYVNSLAPEDAAAALRDA